MQTNDPLNDLCFSGSVTGLGTMVHRRSPGMLKGRLSIVDKTADETYDSRNLVATIAKIELGRLFSRILAAECIEWS